MTSQRTFCGLFVGILTSGAKVCDLTEDLLWFVCGLYVGILTCSLTCIGRYQYGELFFGLDGPEFADGFPQFFVLLVHLLGRTHLDTKRLADQGKQGGRKVNRHVISYRHVHAYQFLKRKSWKVRLAMQKS